MTTTESVSAITINPTDTNVVTIVQYKTLGQNSNNFVFTGPRDPLSTDPPSANINIKSSSISFTPSDLLVIGGGLNTTTTLVSIVNASEVIYKLISVTNQGVAVQPLDAPNLKMDFVHDIVV